MDEQRKKYLEILGLSEHSTETDINNRYGLLCLRAKTDDSIDIELITKAYNRLLNLNIQEIMPQSPMRKKYAAAWVKYFGIASITLIIIATILMIFLPSLLNKNPDLTISYVGPYTAKSDKDFQNYLIETIPDIKKILVEDLYIVVTGYDTGFKEESFTESGIEKLSLLLVSGDFEIIICDDAVYRYILSYNYLLELDDLLNELDIEVSESNKIYGIQASTGEKVLYGINVKRYPFITDRIYQADEQTMILCVFNKVTDYENIHAALKILLDKKSKTGTE